MKTAKRRVLSFLMAMFVMVTTVCGHVDYTVKAETTTAWKEVALTEISSTDSVMITMSTSETTFVLQTESLNKKGAPNGVVADFTNMEPNAAYLWNITATEGGYHIKNGDKYLYVINDNNGVRLGDATKAAVWSLSSDNYLSASDGTQTRYMGVYVSTSGDGVIDWRCYKNTTGNIKNQTLKFWVLDGGAETPEGSDTTAPSETTTEDKIDSPVAPVEPTGSTIAEALAATEGEFTVTGVVTLVDSSNIYVQDATGAICVRMATKPTDIALGDVITGTGSKTSYEGLPQLQNSTYTKVTGSSLTLSPRTTTISALTTADLCTYVEVKGLEVTEVYDDNGKYTSPNLKLTDGTKTIELYKTVVGKTGGVWDVQVGDTIDVKGALSCKNETLRLRNTVASEITVVKKAPAEGDNTSPYNTVAEAVAAESGTFTVKGVVTLVDGQNIYVQDTTGGICVRMSSKPADIALGDTIIGTGSKTIYNGLPQLGSGTYEKSEGFTLKAKATTIGALTTADVGTYIKLSSVEVTEVYDSNGAYTTPNITVTDGTNTIQLYKAVVGKTDGAWDVKVGDVIDICAAVSIYQKNNQGNITLQLRNTLTTEITAAKSYDKISDAVAAESGTFTVKGVVTLVEGQNIYVQDTTGGICVRMSSKPADIALGDTIIGTGSKTTYNGLPQLGSGTYEKSEGFTLKAKETTIGALTAADVGTYIKLSGVEVTEIYDNNGTYTTPNITVTDGTNTIQLYKAVVGKTDGAWDVKVGDVIDMCAAVSIYQKNNQGNITLQLRNTLATEITAHVVAGASNKVTSASEFTTGTYAMVVETGYAPGVLEGTWVTAVQPTIVGDTLTDAAGGVWTLTVTGNTVKITDSNLATIKPKGGNNNGISSGSYDWTWSFNEETGTFSFAGQGSDTVKLASNLGSSNMFRGYKLSTLTGSYASEYKSEFTLYKVEATSNVVTPEDGSKVVIYNVNAKGVLASQDDNTDSPSINNVAATIGEDGKVTVENGGVVFEVVKNGSYFRFYNETYGYLCSRDTGNNAYYSLEACDEADWSLQTLGKGFKMLNKVAKYNGTGDQYLEYYADSYKTYSFYGTNKDGTPADTTIYEFHFLECANTDLTGGIANAPVAVVETVLDANIGIDYTFTFEVDAPFGVKELAVTVNGEAIEYTEAAGIYTVVVPAAKVVGEKLVIVVAGTDNKGVAITSTFNVTVKDEPGIANVTPVAGSETGDNKKPVISAEVTNAGENATVVMTINDEEVAATYADGKVTYTSATDMADGRYNVTVTVTRADGKVATKTWAFTVGKAQFQLYFGQLHSHTTYSDGSGSLDSALNYIASLPESANVDFVAFTDHSNYFDTTSAVNPEGALYDMSLAGAESQALWNAYKGAIANFNASQSNVVALGGFEMTWSGGPGHINTFNTPGIVSRNNKTLNNKTSDAGMKAYYALLSQAEGADSLSQFNHPGSTFGTFSDFSYWDALLDTRIQMVEVGNGEGQIGAGGYFPSYEYYTMALDKGWHLAPTNNQDNHKGKWGNANDARDVVLTDNFTEEGIYQAIREMRMYATEDKNLEVYYTANGFQLGSTIEEVPEKLAINVDLYDPDASDSISKVEVIVNSGKAAYTWDQPSELATGKLTCELDPVYSYYYIRVTQGDGDLAVTAPVWVGETLKLGISAVECGTSTPVTGEEVTLTTTLFNSEAYSAFVKSLTYTVNGSEVIGTDTKGYNVAASGTADIEFKFTPSVAKLTKVTVTAVVEQDGVEYTFSMDVTLDVQDSDKLVYIGIDAAHYNEYVAGNYADSMGNFGKLAAGYSVRTVELKTCEDLIAACSNDKFKAIIMTAPSRRLAASWTDPRTYTAEEIAAIKAFNDNGGTVILASWSDHYESPSKTGNNTGIDFKHMADTQNEVLKALGSSLRINDDATYDDSYNGGQQYRLYFNTYGENFLTEGVEVDPENPHDRLYTEVFSHYGGASVYAVDANGNATTTIPSTVSPVVFGHASTYSVDADEDGIGGTAAPKYTYAEGDDRLMIMALEQIEGKGAIIVSGAAFMSNFEVQATIEDSAQEKNYSNYRICENLVQYVNPVTITPIAEVQAQTEVGYKYTIEGIVTTNASGYDKDTAFFDCIYVQDETGGVCCFPVAGNYKIGDKVRVTGTTEFYQGEMELQVTEIEVIGSGTVAAKDVTAAQINDLSVLGQLVTLKGTVVSFEMANGLVQTIMVKDAAGNVARVFIDGYITTAKDVQNLAVGRAITVTGVSSFDDTFNAPNGPFPRIRVKDRADVVCTTIYVPSTPVEPETEAPSTEAPTTKPGTSTQKPSEQKPTTEETTTETPITEPVEVIIPVDGTVEEKTEAIVEAIEDVKPGNDVVIKVIDAESEEAVVSVEVFKALEENKETNLVVELANGFSWTIDASTVDTSKVEAEAIDLWAGIVENVVPAELVKETAGESADVLEISLKHNGEFGFTAALDVPVGKEFAGRNASLYYYNPETGALEAQELATIDENGCVRFSFTHASDYVVVIEKAASTPVDTEVNTENTVDTEASTEGNTNAEEKGGSPVLAIVLVLLAVAAGCFAFAYSRKKK